VRDGDNFIWGDTMQEVIEKAMYVIQPAIEKGDLKPEDFVKTVTFICGDIYENKELIRTNPGYLANLLAQDEQTKMQLLFNNWKVVVNDNELFDHAAFLGMFNNVLQVKDNFKCITADIAMKGSDKFTIIAWEGFEAIDIDIIDRSDGKQVVTAIENMAGKHRIPNHRIVYDSDGVGSFVDGFIVGAIGFVNNARALNDENYDNLKTQCYYKASDRVNDGGYRISEHVANKMYDNKTTVKQRFMTERRAIKRAKADADGKLKIIPKEQMKPIIGNTSPDLMDAFMMRERFSLVPEKNYNWARQLNKY
jgi:hypothetical protein